LLAASARLKHEGKKFTLTLVGDGQLRSSLEQQIQREGLNDHVHLVGVKSSTEIREILERARAFVLPSFAEGLPVVLMEALALGRPVVTTAIAGTPELVDEQCGWLIPAGSEEALVDAMTAVLDANSKELNRKGVFGRERVKQLHDAERNAENLIRAFGNPRQARKA
jgi:glycosyltransferase involved in cell wall biosynthesis